MLSFQEEMYKESNSSAIQYAKNAIQFSFLLNGAAATALFAKTGTVFILPACIFASGAALATVCMGVTYLVQMLISETWRQEGEYIHFPFFGKIRSIPRMRVEWYRMVAIVLWITSMACFFVAIFMTFYQK